MVDLFTLVGGRVADQPCVDEVQESVEGEADEIDLGVRGVDFRPVVLGDGEESEDGWVGRPDQSSNMADMISVTISIPNESLRSRSR